jgi:HEAT repeat protein
MTVLIEALEKDSDGDIRWRLPKHWVRSKDRRAVDPLACLSDAYGQNWLDYAAAEALGEIGDERALGPLSQRSAGTACGSRFSNRSARSAM